MWGRNRKQSADVADQLEDRVTDLEKYNRRLVELAGALTQNLKEFSDDDHATTNGSG